MGRQARCDLEQLYRLLAQLEGGLGGKRVLGECHGCMAWPRRGVYFFFEPGELRCREIDVQRVVRVGTHALKLGSRSTLWGRLRAHRGQQDGGGNHRGSVFRLHVGNALLQKEGTAESFATWGVGSSAAREVRLAEREWEIRVSQHLRAMSLLWLHVRDTPDPASDRAFIERNCIALLSSVGRKVDPPSNNWLGHFSTAASIRASGLWNVNHTDDEYDPGFLGALSDYVQHTVATRDGN